MTSTFPLCASSCPLVRLLVTDLARALGVSEDVVRVKVGLR